MILPTVLSTYGSGPNRDTGRYDFLPLQHTVADLNDVPALILLRQQAVPYPRQREAVPLCAGPRRRSGRGLHRGARLHAAGAEGPVTFYNPPLSPPVSSGTAATRTSSSTSTTWPGSPSPPAARTEPPAPSSSWPGCSTGRPLRRCAPHAGQADGPLRQRRTGTCPRSRRPQRRQRQPPPATGLDRARPPGTLPQRC
jgi:hypothetical protein